MKIKEVIIVIQNNPNDFVLGETIKAMVDKAYSKSKNVFEKFYRLTRGNSSEVGKKFRSLLSRLNKYQSIENFIDENSFIADNYYYKVICWNNTVPQMWRKLSETTGRKY